jgi:hypothetical protein
MKKIMVVSAVILLLLLLVVIAACSANDNDEQSENPLQNINKIRLAHEDESGKIWETTIVDPVEITKIADLFNSLDLRQDMGGQPITSDRYIIIFYENDNEITTWWIGENLITASALFGGGNHKIQNADFNYNFFERFNGR